MKQNPEMLGMSTLAVKPDSRVEDVRVTDDWLESLLKDGRRIAAPLEWYPRLKAASARDRAVWEPCAAGTASIGRVSTRT